MLLAPPCPWRHQIRRRLVGPSSAGSAPAASAPPSRLPAQGALDLRRLRPARAGSAQPAPAPVCLGPSPRRHTPASRAPSSLQPHGIAIGLLEPPSVISPGPPHAYAPPSSPLSPPAATFASSVGAVITTEPPWATPVTAFPANHVWVHELMNLLF